MNKFNTDNRNLAETGCMHSLFELEVYIEEIREAMKKIEELRWGENGLMPAVVLNATTGEVLTVAYVSRESMARMRELGETVFFSRSRQCLWHKGETSGNTQKVVSVMTDCDEDALVIRVYPAGPACHTGARSCFFEEVEGFDKNIDV
jgi:phosphoribosyl-AMP cyclohydrolase